MSHPIPSRFASRLGLLIVAVSLVAARPLAAQSNTPALARVGVSYQADFAVTGVPKSASSYAVTGLPPGLSVAGANFSAGTNTYALNRPFGTITGTPTAAGNFSFSVIAWEFANQSGTSRTFAYSITVSPAPTSAPVITIQPTAQAVAAGALATFSVEAVGTPSPAYQWRKNGLNIPGATNNVYSIAGCAPADEGFYSVVATNEAGSAVSVSVSLEVVVAPSDATITITVE